MRVIDCLKQDHNLLLVGLAALICVAGSVVMSRLYARTRRGAARDRLPWIFLGAVAGGATIWCTHFVAMLAYKPGVEIAYAPLLTGVSLIVAMLGCCIAIAVGSVRHTWAPTLGGAIFGVGVTAMHYIGMAALTAEALVQWDTNYVAVSVIAAVVGGIAAFGVGATSTLRHRALLTPLLLVLTIVSLHFTGMAAMTVMPLVPSDTAWTLTEAEALLALGVSVVGFLILGTAVASYALEEQSERQSKKSLASLIEGSVDGMLVEAEGKIVIANSAFAEMCGMSDAALIGRPVSDWMANVETMPTGELVQSRLIGTEAPIPVEVAIRIERAPDQTFRIFAVRDLRARLAQERRITHLARNDSLTGLPNRASYLEKLDRQIATAADGDRVAVLAIDLNRFKEVNDVYGHAVGDQLLVHIATQMRDCLKPGEFIARLGGDEFVGVIPIDTREQALNAAERLRRAIIIPMEVDHAEIQCGASVGVAIYPDDATEISALINDADLAMYRAKASLTVDVCFYEEAMDEAVRDRRRMTQALREALDQGQFELHYQIQASLGTGKATGYEALLRWRQPDGSYTPPDAFIPLAEETGLILPIGEWVMRTACAAAASWAEPQKIAVNLSPIQLSHTDLPRLVHQILIETGLKPSRLELEITETAMITDLDRTTHILRQLKLLGVSVAMDDFGTGYSSLSTLRAFPFDKIKLDRSFMSELDGSVQSRAIIRAVLALGESLEIPVLAEGVETQEQLDFLREQGCDEAQGYLLGRPSARETNQDAERAEAVLAAVYTDMPVLQSKVA